MNEFEVVAHVLVEVAMRPAHETAVGHQFEGELVESRFDRSRLEHLRTKLVHQLLNHLLIDLRHTEQHPQV